MKLYAILATLLLSSSISALAIRDTNTDIDTDIDTNSTAIIEDGIPEFDPQELYGNASLVEVEERDLDDLKLEARSPASSIVSCARDYIGTTYLFGGCKSTPPFGPSRGGMDCSCLSRTCVYKATGKTIPRTTSTQYPSNKCKRFLRKSAKPGDLLFWGCGENEGIHHVGIYSKPGYIVHAPKTGDKVKEAKIWTQGICPMAVRCW